MSPRPVRVAYVIDNLRRAGAQLHLAQLAAGLDRQRFEPRVFCLLEGGGVEGALRDGGVPVEVLGLGALYGPRALAGFPRLARRLRAAAVDVVHTYLVGANVYGALAGRLAGVRALITTRRDTGFSRNWRMRAFEEWVVNPWVSRVVAVSPAVELHARRERGLDGERLLTIENGVDVTAWDPGAHRREEGREEWALAPGDWAVGVIASLAPVKGHADFLRAAALVAGREPRARFFIIGDGPLRGALEELARGLGIAERVVFAGARGDVARLLAMLDVVVVPSHTEGMSNALLEAMAMARPVIATAVGGNLDVVRDGETAVLVPPHDRDALAARTLELLRNPSRAEALGRAARRSVAERFGLARMLARYEELYLSLLADRSSGVTPGAGAR